MFLKDFVSKMEKIGLLVSAENHKGKSYVSVFCEDIKKHIAYISDDDSSYLKIYNNVFDLDNPNYIIDNVIELFKTPKEEKVQENYCLYYQDLCGNLRVIEKHYSSITSGYLFNESIENFKDIGELMDYYSRMLNKNKYTIRNVDIRELSDNWKPESLGGNNNSIKYFKVESD